MWNLWLHPLTVHGIPECTKDVSANTAFNPHNYYQNWSFTGMTPSRLTILVFPSPHAHVPMWENRLLSGHFFRGKDPLSLLDWLGSAGGAISGQPFPNKGTLYLGRFQWMTEEIADMMFWKVCIAFQIEGSVFWLFSLPPPHKKTRDLLGCLGAKYYPSVPGDAQLNNVSSKNTWHWGKWSVYLCGNQMSCKKDKGTHHQCHMVGFTGWGDPTSKKVECTGFLSSHYPIESWLHWAKLDRTHHGQHHGKEEPSCQQNSKDAWAWGAGLMLDFWSFLKWGFWGSPRISWLEEKEDGKEGGRLTLNTTVLLPWDYDSSDSPINCQT